MSVHSEVSPTPAKKFHLTAYEFCSAMAFLHRGHIVLTSITNMLGLGKYRLKYSTRYAKSKKILKIVIPTYPAKLDPKPGFTDNPAIYLGQV